ncbi:MAG: selenocysteine-specific translation elongation factor [Planctomycetes bacterium]|nr:selenocysteine-specific translation elongation factor [Planctomycetota bacterium]
MDIQPIVIGTAGHIDHGKSSLVRALTGIDPDRLKEEKERGLTIDLGFAPLTMPDGRTVGMIDVPGHERFVRNMVAGATGIDLVVLVVAADDGVMPQTREHLDIMGLLGQKRGLVALNKVDMVDADMAELAADDVRATLAGTFLADAPIVRVSARTGQGLDELKARMFDLAARIQPRSDQGVFRLPIQRVFSKQGFGAVVTGVPVSGSVSIGDTLEVLPAGLRGKVRGLHAYGKPVSRARAGHSTAINLSDIEHEKVARGAVAATPDFFSPVRMVAVRLRVLASLGRPVTDRCQVRLHTGTADPLGELVLLDRERIEPGEEGLAQVRLEEPVVCAPGDSFILRLASPAETLGGGQILEESRHRLKRFKGFVIEGLTRQERSLASPAALLESILARADEDLSSPADLAHAIKQPLDVTQTLLQQLFKERRARAVGVKQHWIHADRLEAALTRMRSSVTKWFEENALRRVMEVLELRRITELDPEFLDALVDDDVKRGRLVRESGGLIRLAGREVALDEATLARRAALLAALEAQPFAPPSPEELAVALKLAPKELARVLQLCVDEGSIVRVNPEIHLTAAQHARAKDLVVENCTQHGHLEIPQLRDALGTTRKFLIPLLEHFDAKGVTSRLGANRVLKRK